MSIAMMMLLAGIATSAVGTYLGDRTLMGAGFAIGVLALFAWVWRAAHERRRDRSSGEEGDADIDMGHPLASRDAGDGPDGDH